MKLKHTLLILLSISMISGLGLVQVQGAPMVQNSSPQSPAGGGGLPPANRAPWARAVLDSTANHVMGKYSAIALDPFSDVPYVSYFNETDGQLMLAHPVSSGGNCGPKNAWLCEVIVGSGSPITARYTSVAIYNSLAFRKVGIAYVQRVGQDWVLKYAKMSCQILKPCGAWGVETVLGISGLQPMYPSLKYDSTGEPHIAFYVPGYTSPEPAFNGGLRYGSHTTPGGTNWTTSLIDQGATPPGGQPGENRLGVGLYPSLAINSSDSPRIAYFGSDYSNLKYAVYVGNNAGSCFNDNWDCQIIDDDAANTGMFPSLVLTNLSSANAVDAPNGGGDQAYIAYYEQSSGFVKYATNTQQDGCGSTNPNWYCTIVDEVGSISLSTVNDYYNRHVGLSLALDASGLPLVAYQLMEEQGPSSLKVGRPANALGNFMGNCGPMAYWQCDFVHRAPDGNVNEADYVSLVVNSKGLGMIAYSEDESWYNAGWHLWLAFQRFELYLPLTVK